MRKNTFPLFPLAILSQVLLLILVLDDLSQVSADGGEGGWGVYGGGGGGGVGSSPGVGEKKASRKPKKPLRYKSGYNHADHYYASKHVTEVDGHRVGAGYIRKQDGLYDPSGKKVEGEEGMNVYKKMREQRGNVKAMVEGMNTVWKAKGGKKPRTTRIGAHDYKELCVYVMDVEGFSLIFSKLGGWKAMGHPKEVRLRKFLNDHKSVTTWLRRDAAGEHIDLANVPGKFKKDMPKYCKVKRNYAIITHPLTFDGLMNVAAGREGGAGGDVGKGKKHILAIEAPPAVKEKGKKHILAIEAPPAAKEKGKM